MLLLRENHTQPSTHSCTQTRAVHVAELDSCKALKPTATDSTITSEPTLASSPTAKQGIPCTACPHGLRSRGLPGLALRLRRRGGGDALPFGERTGLSRRGGGERSLLRSRLQVHTHTHKMLAPVIWYVLASRPQVQSREIEAACKTNSGIVFAVRQAAVIVSKLGRVWSHTCRVVGSLVVRGGGVVVTCCWPPHASWGVSGSGRGGCSPGGGGWVSGA